ncbi:type VI secretion system tube protein TssD, partial [Aeromonas rivipollensis]|uniref:type VI secretion system tube protein TssD n=1 Tax=Aeromonas rivipollensis TaxID=948519 RepID=UPI003D1B874A
MPTPCYISIEGKTQGNITAGAFTSDSVGNIFVQGHEDEMLVQEFNHQVTVPTDPQSGQPAGQRVHKPFKFTVALNKAVPLMYNALASGEMLPKVTLKWSAFFKIVVAQSCFKQPLFAPARVSRA